MTNIAVEQTVKVLREGLEGATDTFSYFLDAKAGLRNTLAGLSADEASRPIEGNSVAAHAHHLAFSFEAFAAAISGDRTRRDWNESWRVTTVDDTQWQKLQEDVLRGYGDLIAAVEKHGEEGPKQIGGALGALAHTAYHLGAIRQKVLGARG